jgi:hypothetical protein
MRLRYTGEIAGNDRLNIPPLRMNDGPQGFRTSDDNKGVSRAFHPRAFVTN